MGVKRGDGVGLILRDWVVQLVCRGLELVASRSLVVLLWCEGRGQGEGECGRETGKRCRRALFVFTTSSRHGAA